VEEIKEKNFKGFLREDNFTIIKYDNSITSLIEKGYGTQENKYVILDPLETIYLMYKNIIKVEDSRGNEVSFEGMIKRLIKHDKNLWLKFTIYSDLRRRGFIVKKGIMPLTFLVEKRGEKGVKRYMVACLKEGARVGFLELETFFRRSIESNRELIVAIVDKEGNVSYYSVEKIYPNKKEV